MPTQKRISLNPCNSQGPFISYNVTAKHLTKHATFTKLRGLNNFIVSHYKKNQRVNEHSLLPLEILVSVINQNTT